MTEIYFVRHAESDYSWNDDRTRPLTADGAIDVEKVLDFFKSLSIDVVYSSPYVRSISTVRSTAEYFGLTIITDERFRERKAGLGSNNRAMFEKRWNNLDFHEENGESIKEVQKRNIQALSELLINHENKRVIIGHHGTALARQYE